MIKTFLNVPGDQNLSEHQCGLPYYSVAKWGINQTSQNKCGFIFSFRFGRKIWRERRVCDISLACLIWCPFCLSHDGAARVIPLHLQNSSCTGIDIQRLRICSDKRHKSSVISIRMERKLLWKSILFNHVNRLFFLCQALSATTSYRAVYYF